MIKGVNRQVVEVSQPNSRYFDRILYIVKPEYASVGQSKLVEEAHKLAASAKMSRPPRARQMKLGFKVAAALTALASLGAIITAVVLGMR